VTSVGEPLESGPGSARPGVAAFDFDGTLIRGDSFLPFLVAAVGRPRFARVAMRSSGSLGRAYQRGGRDAAKAALLQRLMVGYAARELAVLGERYAVSLVPQVRPAMAQRVAWHHQRGHRLVLVSASLDLYLEHVARALRFDHVLATRLEIGADGRLTGRLAGANVRGAEKATLLRAWLAREFPGGDYELWAYGDSAGDRELLAMADHPTLLTRRMEKSLALPSSAGRRI